MRNSGMRYSPFHKVSKSLRFKMKDMDTNFKKHAVIRLRMHKSYMK